MKSTIAIIIGIALSVTAIIYSETDLNKPDGQMNNFKDGKYRNNPDVDMSPGSGWDMMKKWMFGKQVRKPKKTLPIEPLRPDSIFSGTDTVLKVVWIGHSTLILEIDGARIMLDPVFSNNPSPARFFFSLKRFHGKTPLKLEEVPELDAVIISHDHYDHLDKKTIKKIHRKVGKFFIPQGLGKYLKKWGVPDNKIKIMNWGDSARLGRITLITTPAMHFSGRGLFSQNKTLWTSWVILGPNHKVYFTGDSGYFPGFKKIGEAYGPFDLTLLDCGQYSPDWEPCHMFPEQAVQAHLDLKGKVLMPVHWGTFKLSYHDWYEPAERLVAAADKSNVNYIIPIAGEIVSLNDYENKNWWRDYYE